MKIHRLLPVILGVATYSLASLADAEDGLEVVGEVPENWVVVRDLDRLQVEQRVELEDGTEKVVMVPQVVLQPAVESQKKDLDSALKLEKALSLQSKQLANTEVQMESVLNNLRALLKSAQNQK